jgi:hypothetical protein
MERLVFTLRPSWEGPTLFSGEASIGLMRHDDIATNADCLAEGALSEAEQHCRLRLAPIFREIF